jgi:aminopeptidase N/puromycin-sensitive aminopeptidase
MTKTTWHKSLRFFGFVLLLVLPALTAAQRLPASVAPNHYKLTLDPNIEQKKFSGEETIDVRVGQPTAEIVLNSLNLDISEAELITTAGAQPAKVTYDKPKEMVRLVLPQQLPAGSAQIHLKYSGALTEGLRGLYLSKSKRREYAVTQFEGTYARMMFPCFDEPGYKATFDLAVAADNGDTAISNGKIISDAPLPGSNRHKISFSTSPKMSTYLVALAIGDWQCLERTVDGVPIRVCAIPERKDEGNFALDVAAHSISFYDQWYGIKYPFGKLDMLAIPDYEWGGMENTASIFYRDSALLLDDKNASVLRKRGQSTVIAHEIAHQWFGDLVTPAWWDDIWLNEGFATWMERKPIEAWHPEWHLEDDAAAEAQQIIGLDSLSSARAIHGNPSTPAEIKEMFDGITYEKGGAVLRMLESYVGSETFRRGVNAYLAAHANGNATSADFWHAEAEASGKPIDKIMPTFVLQPGVPSLSIAATCAGGNAKLNMNQQRFLISPGQLQSSAMEQWQIPICLKTDRASTSVCIVAVQKTHTESLNSCPQWIFGNRDGKGYYRVAYAPENLKRIAAIAEQELNTPERIALVEDAWAMTRVGKNSVADFLSLAQSLRAEENRHVIDLLSAHLKYVNDSLVPGDGQDKYRAFVGQQFSPLAQQLGWTVRPGDSDEQKALRAALLGILGDAGDANAVATANDLVQRYMKDPNSVDGTLSATAFTVAAENSGVELYNQFAAAMPKSRSTDEYYHYLYSLPQFRQPELVTRTIALADKGDVRQQEFPRFFAALLSNPVARQPAWEYLKSHWDVLSEKVSSFGGNGALTALGNSCDAKFRSDVQQFFGSHPAPGAERTVKQSLERMNNCIEFKQLQEPEMQKWLAETR